MIWRIEPLLFKDERYVENEIMRSTLFGETSLAVHVQTKLVVTDSS
jgi:hypothetical protein